MVKTKFKKAVSLMLAAVMSLTAFTGIGATTAFAAVGEKADVYLVDYPRSGDTNNNGEWGHGNLNYMNGWKGLSTKYTGLRAMGSYSGNIAYCIEPGTGQRTGDTLTEKDENFFNNISPNGTISGDDIRLLIGRILQYGYRGGILDLGKQLMPIGMLVVLDSILNRITQNRAKGKQTFIFIDEIYLLFQHEYSANFLFTLWKRVRKYGAYATGITQNVDDLLQSHTARTMLANSEFLIMLNQASTDRIELAKLLNISDLQLSYITNVDAGHGLIKVGSSLVPFANKFPKNTKLYKLMTTKPGEGA